VLVTSRSYAEYEAFFALTPADLAGTVLDCSAGASGFAAVANSRGGRVTAVDPAYAAGVAGVLAESASGTSRGAAIIGDHEDRFVWSWYGSPEARDELRTGARAAFEHDLRARPGSYVAGALPGLPFADGAVDLALCSHLLFTWSDVLGEQWHDAALTELLRVARQVRVFPLVVQGTGDAVPFLPRLLDRLRDRGHRVDVVRVGYEFQRGADRLLVVTRA